MTDLLPALAFAFALGFFTFRGGWRELWRWMFCPGHLRRVGRGGSCGRH